MTRAMGTEAYTFAEAAAMYGMGKKNFFRVFRRIGAPWIQPSGKNGKVFFPKIQFEMWLAKGRNTNGH